jgi:hypothetical protein
VDDRGVGVGVAVESSNVLHIVQTGSGAQPASFILDNGGPFPGGTAAVAWN